MTDSAPGLPDHQVCEQARLSRDPRFDGVFFIAVTSTGIYCRPVCPVRSPKPENIRYYPTAAAAEADGFRPCLRCRPELSPSDSWLRGDATVARALKLIEDGYLADRPLASLAERVGVGERQLRRLFVERVGATPPSVHQTRRLLFAKQLLTETSLPILDVALEAGFNSVRRFNACFREAYGLTPSTVRRKPGRARGDDEVFELRLAYRPPYDFPTMLDSLRRRALPGLERVDEEGYTRLLGPPATPGWLRVTAWSGDENALRLELHCRRPTRILDVVTRLRRMLDLDADPQVIADALAVDPALRPLIERAPGLRLPGGWDGFESAVHAILGERGAECSLLERHGLAVEPPAGLDGEAPARLFPGPDDLVTAELTGLGMGEERAGTVRGVARALLDGRVDFRSDRTLDDFVGRWSSLPGVDPRTAHAVALGALGHPDAFPADPAVLRGVLDGSSPRPDPPESGTATLAERTETWRPWRGYAWVQILHHHPPGPRPADR